MNRRDFGRTIAAGLVGGNAVAAAGKPYIRFDRGALSWTVGNDFFEREVAYDAQRGLIGRKFLDKASGKNWMAQQTRWGTDTYVILDHDFFYGAGPGERFQYVDHRQDATELRVRFRIVPQRLDMTLCYRVFDDSPFLEQWCVVENASDKPVGPLERFDPLFLALAPGKYRLNWVQGVRDYGHQRGVGENLQPFAPYRVRKESLDSFLTLLSTAPGERYGRKYMSTTEQFAWFALEDTARNCGLMGGLEWSGIWVLHFANMGEAVLVYGGLDKFSHLLAPGAKLESPRAFYGPYRGDVDDGLRPLHSYIDRYVSPPVEPGFPYVTYNTWFSLSWKYDEEKLKREADAARDIGVECFCLDAGWWQGVDDAGIDGGMGGWIEDRKKFPSGLAAFAEHVRANGMKFGIWLEPERANRNEIGVSIKETFLGKHDDVYAGFANTAVVCFGNPEVREWARTWIARVMRDYKPAWIRWDLNVYNVCNRTDHGHQAGDGDYQHIRGLHEVLAWLVQTYPDVRIEACAGGGNRNDFGFLRNSHTSWISDGSWPSYRVRYQVIGCSYVHPSRFQNTNFVYQGPTTRHSYGVPEIVDAKTPDVYLDYLFRSRLMGAFGISDRLTEWPDNVRNAARRAVRVAKRARPVLQGEVYHVLSQPLILTPPISPPVHWEALEYYHPALDRAVLFCFRARAPQSERTLRLRGVAPDRRYAVISENTGARRVVAGRSLLEEGISISLPQENSSEILWFEKA
jgi:alpha-galactosidase